MSLQPMTLLDSIVAPGSPVLHMSSSEPAEPLNSIERAALKDARRVWVDHALHQRLEFTAKTVNFATDFGELSLPYPHMWIEWNNSRTGSAMALQCLEIAGQISKERSYLAIPWMVMPRENPRYGGLPLEYDEILRLDFHSDRSIAGVSGYRRGAGNHMSVLPTQGGDDIGGSVAGLVDTVWNGLVAIGFMNCKNVTTERHERPQKSSKKQRRKRPPKLDYHTIVLPGYRGHTSGNREEKQDILALHQVRGHFKTFTAEAPLMGKHVGTYWWGWQMRGNAKNGIVVSDYKLNA